MHTTWQRLSEFNRSPKGRALAGGFMVLSGIGLFLLATFRDYAAGPGLGLAVIGLVQLAYAAYLARQQRRADAVPNSPRQV